MNEKSLSNLKPFTKETAKEMGRKGGIASGETKRKRKSIREQIDIALSSGNTQENIVLAQINKALEGDTKAFNSLSDRVDGKVADNINVNADMVLSEKRDDVIQARAYLYGTDSEAWQECEKRGLFTESYKTEFERAEAERKLKEKILYEWYHAKGKYREDIFKRLVTLENCKEGWTEQYHRELNKALKGDDSSIDYLIDSLITLKGGMKDVLLERV